MQPAKRRELTDQFKRAFKVLKANPILWNKIAKHPEWPQEIIQLVKELMAFGIADLANELADPNDDKLHSRSWEIWNAVVSIVLGEPLAVAESEVPKYMPPLGITLCGKKTTYWVWNPDKGREERISKARYAELQSAHHAEKDRGCGA